jgi:hypothetical protein
MKITIEPEQGDTNDVVVLKGVYQFSLYGCLKSECILKDIFRMSVVDDPNELLGLLRMTELDITDFKINKNNSQDKGCNKANDPAHLKNTS